MVHLVATMANDADHTPSLLYALKNDVAPPSPLPAVEVRARSTSSPGTGVRETWGVGYYAEGHALIIRKPGELVLERSVHELAPTVQSSTVLACVHQGSLSREDAPPHRFRHWLFGYAGELDSLLALRARVVDRLPDFIRSEIGDRSGGELAFGMFIAELHRGNLIEDVLSPAEAFAQAMQRTAANINMLTREAGVPAPRAVYAATNGRLLLAARAGSPLFWKLVEGLEPQPNGSPETALTEYKRVAEALKRFRAMVLAREVLPGRPGWTEIPEGSTVIVDRRLSLLTL